MSRLQEKYSKEIAAKLQKEFGIENPLAVPILTKIVVNLGIGAVAKNKEAIESLSKDISMVTGQKPSVRAAKVSIAAFSLRRGMPVGLSITLRGERMYSFLDKLVSIVLPRLRDFRGLSAKSFDKYGNFTLSLSEHTIFPEVDPSKASPPHGLEVTLVMKNSDTEKSKKLLEFLGIRFEKGEL